MFAICSQCAADLDSRFHARKKVIIWCEVDRKCVFHRRCISKVTYVRGLIETESINACTDCIIQTEAEYIDGWYIKGLHSVLEKGVSLQSSISAPWHWSFKSLELWNRMIHIIFILIKPFIEPFTPVFHPPIFINKSPMSTSCWCTHTL